MRTASLIRYSGAGASVVCLALVTACTGSTPEKAPAASPAATAPGASPSPPPPQSPTAGPVFDPGNFGTVVDNPYFPVKPGSTWVYQGVRDGVTQKDVVVATGRTRVVDGVTAVVVTDVATHGSRLLEQT